MTPNTKSDLLYFKTLSYEEIFRLFNDKDISYLYRSTRKNR